MNDMENQISKNIDNPSMLEIIYRKDPEQFKVVFEKVYSKYPDSITLKVWKERLYFKDFQHIEEKTNNLREIVIIIMLSLLAGSIAKITFELIERNLINPINLIYSVFPILAFYFIIKNKISRKKIIIVSSLFIASLIYINILPYDFTLDSVFLANIHLPFLLWSLVGIVYIGADIRNPHRRMDYLRYNGELAIYVSIILISGAILAGLTFGLFEVIDINITEFYMTTVVVFGIASSPIVATYLIKVRKNVAKDFAPYIAKIFSPLILITLIIYLISVIVLQKNPYTNRDFLLIFNMILLSVLAITIYTISERNNDSSKGFSDYITALLIFISLLINGVALSAILFRLTSFGITPNRVAVLGVNIIVFINLILIVINYYKFLIKKRKIALVEKAITDYLPVYFIWTIIVTFGFPLLFNFK